MATHRIQTYRSNVSRQRPSTGTPGQLYVNWPDKQIGTLDSGVSAMDFVSVRFWSVDATYVENEAVYYDGHIWRANQNPTPGEFDLAEWTRLTGSSMRVGTTPPDNPQNGDGWLDKSVNPAQVRIWDANANAYHEVAADKLSLSGGTLSGDLILPSAQSAHVSSATNRAYVDREVNTRLTQTQADARYVRLTGGTMSGKLYAGNGVQVPGGGAISDPSLSFGSSATAIHKYSTGEELYFVINARVAAQIDPEGSNSVSPKTIITQEKGDKRYVRPSELDAYATTDYVDDEVSTRLAKTGGVLTGDLSLPSGGSSSTPQLRFGGTNAGIWVNTDQDNMVFRLSGAETAELRTRGTDAPTATTIMTRERADERFLQSNTSSETLSAFRDLLVANGLGSRGDFVFARYGTANITYGLTVAGSSLRASGSRDGANEEAGPTLSGTWRAHGEIATSDNSRATVWQRIA